MKHLFACALLLGSSATAVSAQVTIYTSATEFHAENPSAGLIEDFENSDPAIRQTYLPSYQGPNGLIGFLGLPSTPNAPHVWLDPTARMTFGAGNNPTTSVILTSSNIEHFAGILLFPATSVGFDLYLNDSPSTLSFFNGDTLLASLTYDSPPVFGQNLVFAGIYSAQGVTRFEWQTTSDVNTGVDNIYAGPIPSLTPSVPEPATWSMMLLGFGAVGFATRRRKRPIAQLA